MFTMPAIHHSSVRGNESPINPMGTMHLNALNGSSDVFGRCDTNNGYSGGQSSVFGGLFGVSLSENHPYRPQDSGSSFHETKKASEKAPAPTPAAPQPSAPTKIVSKHRGSLTPLLGRETTHPVGPRRRSLDLDLVSSHNHCRYDDRSLSLEELAPGALSRTGRYVGDIIDENDFASGLDLTGLSLTEVKIVTEEGGRDDANAKSALAAQKRRRRLVTSDLATSERATRLLEKIRDSKKEHVKQTKLKREDSLDQGDDLTMPAKNGSSRHHIMRLVSESDLPKQQRDSQRQKDKKLQARSSLD